jgi:hypothetical protein
MCLATIYSRVPELLVQKQLITEYVMRKVNRLMYYRLSQYWDQKKLSELFEKVRSNFAAYESGTQAEIEAEIELDDSLLEEEEEVRVEGKDQVNHSACAVCQQEEAAIANAIITCACCFRRFHRMCHKPSAHASVDESLWVCGDCGSGAEHSEDEF